MKIGMICYPTYGGSGVMATELGKALAHKNYEVHFISTSLPVRLDTIGSNIFFHEVNVLNYPLFEYTPYESALISKIVDVVRYEKLDILHVHYAIPHAFAAVIAKQILASQGINIPVVTTLHGTDITLVGRDATYEPTVTFSINQSDAVTAVSQFLKDETFKYFKVKKDICVIPNFVDFERFNKKPKNHFKIAIAPNDEKIIVHTSNFREVKRLDDVLHVFEGINKVIPSKLLLMGDGPDRSRLELLTRKMDLVQDVRFLGKIEAVEEVLSIADLFLLPSERESFGLAALEAMACQVPVISSDAEGIPEVNVDGVTGYVSKIGNVKEMAANALKILSDPAIHQQFKLAAFERAKEFDLKKIIGKYEEVYKKLLAKNAVMVS